VSQQTKQVARALFDAWLPVEDLPDKVDIRWLPRPDDGDDSATPGIVLLPLFFGQATFGCDEHQHGFVEFTFNDKPPTGWALFVEDDRVPFLNEASWQEQGSPILLRHSWERDRAPSGFRVSWQGSGGCAWWPVNVLTSAALPPPNELKDLSLEMLIEILTSAKPLHQVLDPWLRRQKGSKAHDEGPLLDPHKRVDTSSFLLQRTRRVSDALTCLRRRLERPVVSEQALEWRLHGPVGVIALAQAVGKEARSEQERCFLLTELCLELARVRPQTSPGSFSPARVCKSLRQVTQEIRATISSDALTCLPALATYLKVAFEEIAR
jgi:hypothetical protein